MSKFTGTSDPCVEGGALDWLMPSTRRNPHMDAWLAGNGPILLSAGDSPHNYFPAHKGALCKVHIIFVRFHAELEYVDKL